MKKTRPYISICFNYSGNPWCVTSFIGKIIQPIKGSVVSVNFQIFSGDSAMKLFLKSFSFLINKFSMTFFRSGKSFSDKRISCCRFSSQTNSRLKAWLLTSAGKKLICCNPISFAASIIEANYKIQLMNNRSPGNFKIRI